jgi:hypothetical protein
MLHPLKIESDLLGKVCNSLGFQQSDNARLNMVRN